MPSWRGGLSICRNDPTILIRLGELASGDEPRVDDTPDHTSSHRGAAPETAGHTRDRLFVKVLFAAAARQRPMISKDAIGVPQRSFHRLPVVDDVDRGVVSFQDQVDEEALAVPSSERAAAR